MNTLNPPSGTIRQPLAVNRVADDQWHAVEDSLTVGRGDVSCRNDGRTFLSIDAWHDAAFDQLAVAILADVPTPLHTVADDADHGLIARWERIGFTIHRREQEFLLPTDPNITGWDSVRPPSGVTIVPFGQAEEVSLRALDRTIRDEVEATVGWHTMPAEIVALPDGVTVVDPSKYAAAAQADEYVGFVRLATTTRQPRIGLVAVRADLQRRGIARALLARVLGSLHRSGVEAAYAEVDESNTAAMALFDGVGAQRRGGILELVMR